MKIASVAFLLCLCASAEAVQWEYVAATGGSNVYVDVASIKADPGKSRSASFLFDHLDARYDIDSARVFKSSIHLIMVDCAAQRLNWSRMEKYAGPLATGTRVSARNVDNQAANALETIPDNARTSMLETVCSEN